MSKSLRASDLVHDIASAVFRVAALVRHGQLRMELERVAVELVKDIEPKAIDRLERLVRFTEAVEEMSQINAGVLCRELGNLRNMLDSEISESFPGIADTIDLREIFAEKGVKEGLGRKQEIRDQGGRQGAILAYIRKFPNGCRMRQLSVAFTDFSERTVRADVQRLIDKGLIEKIGSKTGPFSYFRVIDSLDFQPKGAVLPEDTSVTKEELFSL